jgi:hypothetical protein
MDITMSNTDDGGADGRGGEHGDSRGRKRRSSFDGQHLQAPQSPVKGLIWQSTADQSRQCVSEQLVDREDRSKRPYRRTMTSRQHELELRFDKLVEALDVGPTDLFAMNPFLRQCHPVSDDRSLTRFAKEVIGMMPANAEDDYYIHVGTRQSSKPHHPRQHRTGLTLQQWSPRQGFLLHDRARRRFQRSWI